MKPFKMKEVIGGIKYDTEKAEIIADDCYWDGHNWERNGRNTFLYKTQNGRYFVVRQTLWQGERDQLEPLTIDEAIILMNNYQKSTLNLKMPSLALRLKRHNYCEGGGLFLFLHNKKEG